MPNVRITDVSPRDGLQNESAMIAAVQANRFHLPSFKDLNRIKNDTNAYTPVNIHFITDSTSTTRERVDESESSDEHLSGSVSRREQELIDAMMEAARKRDNGMESRIDAFKNANIPLLSTLGGQKIDNGLTSDFILSSRLPDPSIATDTVIFPSAQDHDSDQNENHLDEENPWSSPHFPCKAVTHGNEMNTSASTEYNHCLVG